MTSVQSFAKQIPLNNGYYRVIPSITAALGATNDTVPENIYIPTYLGGGTVVTSFTPLSAAAGAGAVNFNAYATANASTLLLKDMGKQVRLNGSTFRRVQAVVTGNGAANGVGGPAAGGILSSMDNYSDYLCGYILLGFGGAGVAGPFVRTG
jgi:hypothetical protein